MSAPVGVEPRSKKVANLLSRRRIECGTNSVENVDARVALSERVSQESLCTNNTET